MKVYLLMLFNSDYHTWESVEAVSLNKELLSTYQLRYPLLNEAEHANCDENHYFIAEMELEV